MGADYYVPNFLVKINQDRISTEMTAAILGITVEEKLDLPAQFTMTLSDPELNWVADAQLSEGAEIKVELGYLNETVEIFDGEVTGLQAEFSSEGPATVTVRGYDRLHRLARDKKTKTYKDMKDKQIAQEIAGDVSLQLDSDVEGEKADYVLQSAQTNLEFLKERSRRLGAELGVHGKKLVFKKPAGQASEAATVEWGKTLMDFSTNLSVVGQITCVKVRGWDPEDQAAVTGEAKAGDQNYGLGIDQSGAKIAQDKFGENVLAVTDNTVKSQNEAENLAKAYLREANLRYNQSEGQCLGEPKIRVGKIIKVKGVGSKLNGKYYVVAVQHELNRDGYVTRFKACRNGR